MANAVTPPPTPTWLDIDSALRGLQLAVEAYGPDYVDPNSQCDNDCLYSFEDDNGKTRRCIAGEALHQLGYAVDSAAVNDYGQPNVESIPSFIGRLEYAPGVKFDIAQSLTAFKATAVLLAAQQKQDLGRPWSEALEAAEAVAATLTT